MFGPLATSGNIDLVLGNFAAYVKPFVKNVGFIFDSDLLFDMQVNAVVKSCFFHLRLLDKVKSFLTPFELERVLHAFIFSRLDYCNLLYCN